MAAPNYALRTVVFVNKIGTDDAGYNAVGAPQSHLTIASALADLAANYPAATLAAPHIVAIGPGDFAVAAEIDLPANTYIVGSCDGQGQPNTVLTLADSNADIILATSWSVNATKRGGIGNVTIRAASGTPVMDFTMPVPTAGNPSRTLEIFNVRTNLTVVEFEGTGTGDVFNVTQLIHDGAGTDLVHVISGTFVGQGMNLLSDFTLESGAVLALAATVLSSRLSDTVTVTKGAAGCVVSFDCASWPVRTAVTTGGGPTLTRLNDANGEGYSPLVPGNWPVVPTTVQEALDDLAAGGAVVPANSYVVANNAAGNTTITPAAHNLFVASAITGAARTSVFILATTVPPAAGDRIAIGFTFPATANIILEMRNSVVGGTLIYTFTTDGLILSGLFEFVYTGAAWTFAGYQVPYQT